MTYQMEKRRQNFKQEYQEDWARVEELLIVAMLYHSNSSIEETKKFLSLSGGSGTPTGGEGD
jgi:hypothetical protein